MQTRFLKLFLLTAALLALLALFVTALAGEEEDPRVVYDYTIEDNTVVITGYRGSEQNLVIPETIEEYPVVGIAQMAFENDAYITSLTVPGSVRYIGDCAFDGCTNLSSLTLSGGLRDIRRGAFQNCTNLGSLTLPGSVRDIGESAFDGCTNLSSLSLANGLVSIGNSAFAHTKIKAVRLPDSLKSLGTYAFRGCGNFEWAFLPKGLTTLGNDVFSGCAASLRLSVYNESPGHQYAQDYKIDYRILIESITMPDVSIEPGETLVINPAVLPGNASVRAFDWANSAPDVIQMSSPGDLANIKGLKPGTATITAKAMDRSGTIGSCTVTVRVRVTDINITPNTASVEQGKTLQLNATVLPDNATNKNLTWASSDTGVATVDAKGLVKGVKPGTATITATAQDGSGVSANCAVTVKAPVVFVTGISITPSPASVEQGKSVQLSAAVQPATATNKNLTWASSDSNVATVDAKGLVKGVKPGTTTITATAQDGSGVSGSCAVTVKAPVVFVTGISITPSPASVEQGKPVQLSTAVQPATATNKDLTWVSGDTSVATVDAHGLVTGVNPGTVTITATAQDGSGVKAQCSITVYPKPPAEFPYSLLPDGTIRIVLYTGSAAEVRVPEEIKGKPVTEIGISAFFKKAGITKVILPASIRVIDDDAFARCGSLRSINLPEGLHTLGKYVFGGCKNLTAITLPASLTSIGNSVFSHSGLTSITIPDSVSSLGRLMFSNCLGLTQAKLPDKLTSIPEDLFLGCKSLRDITLPVSLTSIGKNAFCGCKSLTSITLPGSLTSIGEGAFYACSSLTSITIRAHVTSIGESAFTKPLTIYGDVPSAAKEYADKNKIPFVDLAKVLPGDANNDGRVDINDLTCLMDYLVKGAVCPSMKNADANQSGGNPDIEDLKTVINMIIAP